MPVTKIPDIEGPTVQLCWVQNFPTKENPAPKNAMARCDRRKGHGGKHTWELDNERTLLRTALVGLVGVDGHNELEQMEGVMRLMPAPAQDKAATIDAIHALLATLGY